ncbi:sigma-70 family RNA polymerase sigma factor [Lactobacillaceae bacterium Scapto_B20]
MSTIRDKKIEQETELIRSIQTGNEESIKYLFLKYIPVVNSIWRHYFINGMDKDDWYQESLIVLAKIVFQYNCDRGVSFGSYYRQALKNRFFDLIRRRNAKKRLPDNVVSSFNAFENFYSETVVDISADCPEKRIMMKEQIEAVLNRLSFLEKIILLEMSRSSSVRSIAKKYHYPEGKVINAFERCKRKFNEYQSEMNG